VERLFNLAPFLDEGTCLGLVNWEHSEQALNAGQLKVALAGLTESIKYIPGAGAYLRRGEVYLKLGQFDEAIKDLSKSLELSASSAKAYFARSRAYSAQGLSDLSQADYEKAVELDPGYGPRKV